MVAIRVSWRSIMRVVAQAPDDRVYGKFTRTPKALPFSFDFSPSLLTTQQEYGSSTLALS